MAPIVEGYWGKQTATLDWCEDNYAVSYYVAEFWNTLSNALMLLSPALMVSLGLKEDHEKRFVYSFIALAENNTVFSTLKIKVGDQGYVSTVYIVINIPIFHEVSYALLILLIVAQSTKMLL
ncbi:alkaline ceramidase 3 [Elysia marginata]|uniref:Alkaline ceramidase n=1 Tax=Elysia marginata TaxID=1093978 RepID=A0AAV4JBT4_9GAST|nr:alkaline ceramidase 3 [Elysia marginata]